MFTNNTEITLLFALSIEHFCIEHMYKYIYTLYIYCIISIIFNVKLKDQLSSGQDQ